MYRPDYSYTVRTRKVREQSLFGGGLRRPRLPLWPRWRRRCSGGLSIRLGRRIPFGLGHRCFDGYLYAHEQSQRERVLDAAFWVLPRLPVRACLLAAADRLSSQPPP